MVELTKPCIVVWQLREGQKVILVKTYTNGWTGHNQEYESAEFDTPEELDQFIIDNDLVDLGVRPAPTQEGETGSMEL